MKNIERLFLGLQHANYFLWSAYFPSAATSSTTPHISVVTQESLLRPGHNEGGIVFSETCEYALEEGNIHGVVSGNRQAFTRCEDEQIHIPGAIQSHGMLVGLQQVEGPGLKYLARVISENSYAICKYAPTDIFALDNFLQVFPVHQRPLFHSHAHTTHSKYVATAQSAEAKVFSISFMDPCGYLIPCWCAMHYLGGSNDLLLCEFEFQNHWQTETPATSGNLPSTPYNALGSDPLDAASSLENLFNGDGRMMEVLNVMSQIQRQFSAALCIQDLLDSIVGIILELTNFHRCMIYEFDQSFNGKVVAELVNPQASSDIYKGLHFPATDIPKQARELYKINKVRVIFDREQKPARLVCRSVADLATPIDLSYSYLRAISPVHLKYLGNMGNELWGLICCHSYGPTGTKIPFPVRELCYWMGLCASNCLDKLLNATKLQAHKVLDAIQVSKTPGVCITASSEELLRLFSADSGFLVVHGEARTIGKLASYLEAVTLLNYVNFRKFDHIFASENVTRDFSDLNYPPGFKHIAGLMFIPLSSVVGDFVVFFRQNQVKEVHWAGNPNIEKFGLLEPRNSFTKWTERVSGVSKEWTEEQFDAAAMARLVYGNFIKVWREKEVALQDSRMKQLLLRNVSHEVRTPLNAIVNYLEMALESPLDDSTRETLSLSHSASKSLVYVIDDLLHLTGSKKEPTSLIAEAFNIRTALHETCQPLRQRAIQKSISFEVVEHPNFPYFVRGDLQRLQQVVSSLVLNAFNFTSEGSITVHLNGEATTDNNCLLKISVEDTGIGMSEKDLDDLFQEFEQVPDEETREDKTPLASEQAITTGSDMPLKLGLGLALVARFIRNINGQIRVRSTKGRGSTFSLEIPLQLCSEASHPLQAFSIASIPCEKLSSHEKPLIKPEIQNSKQAQTLPSRCASPVSEAIAKGEDQDGASKEFDVPNESLFILIADDNAVNLAILQRRLEKMGHEVKISRDGQECFDIYKKHSERIDFILMDLNMPFIDGLQATKMIRASEEHHGAPLPHGTQAPGRIPIFAVSASLNSDGGGNLMETGFDGWLLKPIDFQRLGVILSGARRTEARKIGLYKEVEFVQGGWFS
ncbi:phytochrome-like protein [Glonium stellatum]|uniref:Phytochrome-like protein n=1 Tax=Glonium stellatum TaxID=574774 RepID=A0A8E2FBA5_9PEZI|nr:phytochrome-like protein [Glonium stellatum]